jgi:hypothetical protein
MTVTTADSALLAATKAAFADIQDALAKLNADPKMPSNCGLAFDYDDMADVAGHVYVGCSDGRRHKFGFTASTDYDGLLVTWDEPRLRGPYRAANLNEVIEPLEALVTAVFLGKLVK